MDDLAYVLQLLRGPAPAPSPLLQAEEQLSVTFLRHLLVIHKYVQEYRDDTAHARAEINLITRILDGLVSACRSLQRRFYNPALAELRAVYEALNLMRYLTRSEEALATYLSTDAHRVLREFTPAHVHEQLGPGHTDDLYSFLTSYATHPFYTGSEFLLGVDVADPDVDVRALVEREYPALDAVVASVLQIAFAHTTYEVGTDFGRHPLVDQDREFLNAMYEDVDAFLGACEKLMGSHRAIDAVVAGFRKSFPPLLRVNAADSGIEVAPPPPFDIGSGAHTQVG